MENPKTYSWIYLVVIFIVFVVVIFGGITVYNKTTENWKVLTMDDEGDLVYATVPNFTDVTDDSDKLQLNGKLEVTDEVEAGKLEVTGEVEADRLSIGTGASNFNGATTFTKKLFVRDGLENTNTSKTFKWGGVTIQNDVLNSPTVNTDTFTSDKITVGDDIVISNEEFQVNGSGMGSEGKSGVASFYPPNGLLANLRIVIVYKRTRDRGWDGEQEWTLSQRPFIGSEDWYTLYSGKFEMPSVSNQSHTTAIVTSTITMPSLWYLGTRGLKLITKSANDTTEIQQATMKYTKVFTY
jgi:hypothetical protein